jgi:hypothetical protein
VGWATMTTREPAPETWEAENSQKVISLSSIPKKLSAFARASAAVSPTNSFASDFRSYISLLSRYARAGLRLIRTCCRIPSRLLTSQ